MRRELFPPSPQPHTGKPDQGFLTGQLLVAMPSMTAPPFAGTVIYLCAHNQDGAMGIVVNQPLRRPDFAELLSQLGVEPTPPSRRIALCNGGPVDSGRGFVLHSRDWTGDGSLIVDDDVVLTASLDVLQAIASGGGPKDGMLALGYAGWAAGQLDQEIQDNAWLSVPATHDILFGGAPDHKWRRAFASLRIDPLLLSEHAGHA